MTTQRSGGGCPRARACLAVLVLSLGVALNAGAQTNPADCEGAVSDAEPGTPDWYARDLNNVFCAEQRHLDKALHPVTALPLPQVANDAYREPSQHDGVRFRYDETTIDGLEAEVYRPCAEGTCPGLPGELGTFEPPYPAVVVLHGGLSRKELHWWSSQPLAEAGYLVVAFDAEGVSPNADEARSVLDWLFAGEDPLAADFDGEQVGIAGHSAGGVVVSRLGHTDPRVSAIVSWDRAQSSTMPDDLEIVTPVMFQFADYNCQAVPVCQPEPRTEAPNPDGPGNKGEDFERAREAGVDTMQIALRAATHLDWVPSELSGNRYAGLVSMYYTLAWFDRYLKGADDPAMALDGYERLTAEVFDDSVDVHNVGQGFWDPVQAALSGDPLYGGNVPYAIEDMPVANRLSFYFLSKCDIGMPASSARASSDDIRRDGCTPGTGG